MSGAGTISFSSVPPNARVPLFHLEFDNTQAGVNQTTQRTLIMGNVQTSLASLPVYVPSAAWASATFGAGSMLANTIGAYMKNDPYAEVMALPVYDTGATSATGSVVIGGTFTAAGQLSLYVNGREWAVPIAAGQTGVSVASSVGSLGVVPASSEVTISGTIGGGTINLASTVGGLAGNGHDIRLNYRGSRGGEALPPGGTVTINAFSGGAGAPTLTGLSTALGDANFDFIVCPYTDATTMAAMQAVLADTGTGRWSDYSQSYGHAWSVDDDTLSNLVTFGGTVNGQHQTVFGIYNSPTPNWTLAGAITGAAAPALRADPARPVQTLPVLGVLAPAQADRFTKSQRQTLLTNGLATVTWGQDGSCAIERAATTYQLNKYGQPDQSYLDTETLYTLMFLARDMSGYVTQQFPRAKLANDGTRFGPGQPIVTPSIVKAALIARYNFLETQGLVENTAAFAAGLVVQRNANDPSRLDVLYDPNLVSGLRIFAALTEFRLAA